MRKLGRTTDQRKAMLRGMVTLLLDLYYMVFLWKRWSKFGQPYRCFCNSRIQLGVRLPTVRNSPLRYSATFTKPLSLS